MFLSGLFGIGELEKREIKTREIEEKSKISPVWHSEEIGETDIKMRGSHLCFLLH
jgi:hypothetical protein